MHIFYGTSRLGVEDYTSTVAVHPIATSSVPMQMHVLYMVMIK